MWTISNTSFPYGTVDIYNNQHNINEHQLNQERLEEAWFIHQIIKYEAVLTWSRLRNEVDIDRIAVTVYSSIAEVIDNKWLEHRCDKPGCNERCV